MSQSFHFIPTTQLGYGLSSGTKCLPCFGVSGKPVILTTSLHSSVDQRLKFSSLEKSFMSKAEFGRKPEFSNQGFNGFSVISLSESPKFQATAVSGQREKDIVELFKKMQTQLRERASNKTESKLEALQGKGKDNEMVESLISLSKRHSVHHGITMESEHEHEPISDDIDPILDDFKPVSDELEHIPNEHEPVSDDYESISDGFDPFSDEDGDKFMEDIDEQGESKDLNALKLTEVRSLAKSSEVKGFSKMNETDLVEALSGFSV